MKIFNLILLNLCFLELFSLLSGMNPGQGPSGSQGPEDYEQLKEKIEHLLQYVGHFPAHTGHAQAFNNVREEYNYLFHQYGDLIEKSAKINEELRVGYTTRSQYPNNPGIAQEISRVMIEPLVKQFENNKAQETQLLSQMKTLHKYVEYLYDFNYAFQDEGAGTSEQGQHQQGQHGRGRRDGGHGTGPNN
uniref:Uncharacterized protein n=1 Tax=Meloidogyne enterolobii TaxID=390850 RepID=A0A6V7TPK8_MELEN|nr:unnamed protein product [Meloidogyne enterolobii]